MLDTLTLTRPDDWHTHFRSGALMRLVAPYTARIFSRAIAMPNLSPPLTDIQQCLEYRQLLAGCTAKNFTPLMTLYLTDTTSPRTIIAAKPDAQNYHYIFGAKLYPYAATTNTDHGVKAPLRLMPVFAAMAKQNLPLLVHGEIVIADVDIYDREKLFIDRVLMPVQKELPELKIVFEHITTREAVAFVSENVNMAATITPHHLLYNRNALFAGGLRPHRYCLPLAKRENDRLALMRAACSGNAKFFLGSDSAPHAVNEKHNSCGCAGIFNAPCALETCAEIFEEMNALDRLEKFVSLNGAGFYGVSPNSEQITLRKQSWTMARKIENAENKGMDGIVPFRAGETIGWRYVA